MADAAGRPTLQVEGKNDIYAIINLMHCLGVDSDTHPDQFPTLNEHGGVSDLLKGFVAATKAASSATIGFVIDADSPLQGRWDAVRHRLASEGVHIDSPEEPLPGGFIGRSKALDARVGVWLMPDNQHDGTLETFLRLLVAENDPLIAHAETSTDEAITLEAPLGVAKRSKGVMYAWLAWQEEPGQPFGTALNSHYFDANRPAGQAFADWFKKLYEID